MLLLISALFSLALCANYSVVYSYAADNTNCDGNNEGFVATNNPASCTPVPCSCTQSVCSKIECGVTELPPSPSNGVIFASYPSSDDCSGEPSTYAASVSGRCVNTTTTITKGSQMFDCNGGNFRYRTWTNSSDCSGAGTSITYPVGGSICVPTGGSSQFVACNSVCFHKDTTIGYEGKDLKLHDIATSQDCAIPHKVVSDGVKVSTTCPGVLRLTHRHLVMTADGWKEAGHLKKGDKLFSKIHSETSDCEVTSIQTERKQHYFGLNCYNSNVLADGYWVSTFGSQHHVPAAWMRYGGAILGIQRASDWGDAVVSLLEDWGVLSRQ